MKGYLSIDEMIAITEQKIKGSVYEILGTEKFLQKALDDALIEPVFFFSGYGVFQAYVKNSYYDTHPNIQNIWSLSGFFRNSHSIIVRHFYPLNLPKERRESPFRNLGNNKFILHQNSGTVVKLTHSNYIGNYPKDELNPLDDEGEINLVGKGADLFHEKPIYDGHFGHEELKDTIIIDRSKVYIDINELSKVLILEPSAYTLTASTSENVKVEQSDQNDKVLENGIIELEQQNPNTNISKENEFPEQNNDEISSGQSLLEVLKRKKGVFNYIGILNAVSCLAYFKEDEKERIAEWLLGINAHELNFYELGKFNDFRNYGNHPHGVEGCSYSEELLTFIKNNQEESIRASRIAMPYWKIEDILQLINFSSKDQHLLKNVFERANLDSHIGVNNISENLESLDDLLAENERLRQQLQQVQLNPSKPQHLDNYTTPAIEVMNEVIKEYWLEYHPSQPAPKQVNIVKWITDNFDDISEALALNIDKVCRHSNAKSGGKYKR